MRKEGRFAGQGRLGGPRVTTPMRHGGECDVLRPCPNSLGLMSQLGWPGGWFLSIVHFQFGLFRAPAETRWTDLPPTCRARDLLPRLLAAMRPWSYQVVPGRGRPLRRQEGPPAGPRPMDRS